MTEYMGQDAYAAAGADKILALLKGLKEHPTGLLIYQQIEQILLDAADEQSEVEQIYASLLGTLLDGIAQQIPGKDPLRLEIRLAQRSIKPPLSRTELRTLRHHIERWADRIQDLPADDKVFHRALTPLLEALGVIIEEPLTPARESVQPIPPESHAVEQKVDSAYRYHLDEKSKDFQRLQATLAHQIEEAIKHHEEFGVLLEVAAADLQEEEVEAIADRKRLVLQEVEKFLTDQRDLTTRLDETYRYLQRIADDTRRLSDELNRVRQLSLTDELTGLPNRRAFHRRLEDETSRVTRYGGELTMAMIDLDGFKAINDTYGHAVGDQVLVAYAQKILTTFRHNDLVGRYGGEEFAVLLPNTDLQGVQRALTKVRARVPEVILQVDELTFKPPTFSAGVAAYHSGETADEFISRADAALYRAKELGRNRTEVAQEDQPGAP